MPLPSPLRALVVDSSIVARLVIARSLGEGVTVLQARDGAEALKALTPDVHLVVLALNLSRSMTGQQLAHQIRALPAHERTPILVVSGDTREALVGQAMGKDVTDYFDKREGMEALGIFFQSYLYPTAPMEGSVFHVEDSRSVAAITARQLSKYGLTMTGVTSAEDAIALIQTRVWQGETLGIDLILCDHYLLGEKTGLDVVRAIRAMDHAVVDLPILVTTGEENPVIQQSILSAGADDLLEKPMREAQMVAKIRYHLWRSRKAMRAPEPGKELETQPA